MNPERLQLRCQQLTSTFHDQNVKMQHFLIIVTWLNEFIRRWFDYFFRFNLQKIGN